MTNFFFGSSTTTSTEESLKAFLEHVYEELKDVVGNVQVKIVVKAGTDET